MQASKGVWWWVPVALVLAAACGGSPDVTYVAGSTPIRTTPSGATSSTEVLDDIATTTPATAPITAPGSTVMESTTSKSMTSQTVGLTTTTVVAPPSLPGRTSTTTPPLPICGPSDITVALDGVETHYTFGQVLNVVVVATNISAHACQAVTGGGIEERDPSGKVVVGEMGGAHVIADTSWDPGTTQRTPFGFTQPAGPSGTYTLTGSWATDITPEARFTVS